MTRGELNACFVNHKEEFLEDGRLPADRPSQRSDLCAFILLDKLLPGSDSYIVAAAEHNKIFLDVDLDELAKVATEEDRKSVV